MEPHSTPTKFLESDHEKLDPHLYRQLIGSLIQLATWTRPDISYSVSILSLFFSNPAQTHWTWDRRVVNNLKTTQDSVLLRSSEQGLPVTNSRILDSDHMTGNSELLDGTTCLVPSISVYLGNNEKLMAMRIGSFKSPKISIPVLVVLGLNVNLISCAQLCADLQCWIVLNGLEATSTTKEQTRYARSKLLETYSFCS